ncbi:MAG: DUF4174 domain-containing protein [Pseudomonadota bacterium]
MYTKLTVIGLLSLVFTGCGQAYDTHPEQGDSPLASAAMQNRLLVICTGDDTGATGLPLYAEQYDEVAKDWAGYLERDMIVVWLRDDVLTNWTPFLNESGEVEVRQLAESQDIAGLRARTNCAPGSRGVHLIGKDTGLKNTWRTSVSNKDVFAIIDAMPMRQQEMRSN